MKHHKYIRTGETRTVESNSRTESPRNTLIPPNSNDREMKMFDNKNVSCLSSPYLNKADEACKNINYYESHDLKPSKFLKKNEENQYIINQRNENTKIQLRNQILDLELLKLPSIDPDEAINSGQFGQIGSCKTGKNFMSSKQVIHPSNISMKKHKALSKKDDNKLGFNAMLNKTRVDNLPPLQELTVFEQKMVLYESYL
jgi:hypothetical protein